MKLNVHGQEVLVERESVPTRTYKFEFHSKDGAEVGDGRSSYRRRHLVDSRGTVISRFRNKVFSSDEVGSFELVGELEEKVKDEVIISGLAVLTMVQSLNLAGMDLDLDLDLVKGSPNWR